MIHDPVIERLSDDLIKRCRYVYAVQRQESAVRNHRVPGNNLAVDAQTSLLTHYYGLLGEAALYQYLMREYGPVIWHIEYEDGPLNRRPDIEIVKARVAIDAKTCTEHGHKLLVQADGTASPNWIYLSACRESLPLIYLRYWCWGAEALAFPVGEPQPGRPAHGVLPTADCARSIQELVERLRNPRCLQ